MKIISSTAARSYDYCYDYDVFSYLAYDLWMSSCLQNPVTSKAMI